LRATEEPDCLPSFTEVSPRGSYTELTGPFSSSDPFSREALARGNNGKSMMMRTVVLTIAFLAVSAMAGFAQAAAGARAPATQLAPASETAASTTLITLAECVAAAQAASPNLRLTTIAEDTARADLAQALAKNGLTLGESGTYSHQGNLYGTDTASPASSMAAAAARGSGANGENFKGGLSLTGPNTSFGLTAQHSIAEGALNDQVSALVLSGSQTVFDGYPGGQPAGARKEAEAAYRISQVAYDAAVKAIVYQVKQAYYVLLGDQDTVVLRQATAGQAAENLTLYQGLYASQRATTLDVLQVQIALTQAQLDIRSAQNTVVSDRKRLSLAIGWVLEKPYSVADSPLPDLPALGPDDALKAALQNRSELLILQQNIDAAGIVLLRQKSQALPVVSLNASLGVGQDWTANVNNGAFTAGVSVALPPIYDGGLQNALVLQAANQLSTYKVQQAQEQQSIAIAVQDGLFGVRDAKDRYSLAVQSLQQAQGQYDLQKERLAVGLGTTLDELTAFSTLASVRVGMEQAKIDYFLALLSLDTIMGL
jgi:outer membrane protein TolC